MDDFLCCGFGAEYERSLALLKKSVSWGSWKINNFSHCGKQVSSDGHDVIVSQDIYVQKIEPVRLESRKLDRVATARELEEARGALGGMGWAPKHEKNELLRRSI